MKVIFGTTNKRKIEDLQNLCSEINVNLEILSLEDIYWNLGDIEENGFTIEENSLIKATAIYDFCQTHNINYPIITDDAGLFCEALDERPGIYTARYADDELALDSTLPKYQCVIKLLRDLKNSNNRNAYYKCVVTCMLPDGSYFQESSESKGTIATEIIGELKKPYFYSVFILDGYKKAFSDLSVDELKDTYRYNALKKILKKI
ncbi:MAG: non-canonical purine NTP pyrophosphatase [Bacilli bacterium]|nr:non-canonical purine NTP pyrophosphatase [Bacilli bacterium]